MAIDRITLSDLESLLTKINAELLNLNGLEQTPTVLAKINQLGLMKYDLSEIIRKLKTSPPQMTIDQVPITKDSATAFLASLSSGSYTDLFGAVGAPGAAPGVAGSPAAKNLSGASGNVLGSGFDQLIGNLNSEEMQQVFSRIQDIKWSFQLSYDPQTSRESELLDRLEALEKKIVAYSSTGTAIPDEIKVLFTRELQLITDMIKNTSTTQSGSSGSKKSSGSTKKALPPSSSGRTPTGTVKSDSRVYDSIDTISYDDTYNGSILYETPYTSGDVRRRPGFEMTDDQIRHRASAAAFISSRAGGADYKDMAKNLCSQIRGAGIGDPALFGCIDNPSEVGTNYSWKGNYNMICNRLGDTWGGWYPEMFGCPKYSPDDRYNGSML
jgi:hypothetical protein